MPTRTTRDAAPSRTSTAGGDRRDRGRRLSGRLERGADAAEAGASPDEAHAADESEAPDEPATSREASAGHDRAARGATGDRRGRPTRARPPRRPEPGDAADVTGCDRPPDSTTSDQPATDHDHDDSAADRLARARRGSRPGGRGLTVCPSGPYPRTLARRAPHACACPVIRRRASPEPTAGVSAVYAIVRTGGSSRRSPSATSSRSTSVAGEPGDSVDAARPAARRRRDGHPRRRGAGRA